MDGEPKNPCEAFSEKADVYAEFRERYDAELMLPPLRHWCGLQPQWTVADVGAGTGMLGDVFRANGNRVIAIEPNAEMRKVCARLHAGDAQFEVANGTAEATGLDAASVEMIAVGRALHWFDAERALGEFRRILKPRGWVAIVACGREERGRAENEGFEELLHSLPGQLERVRAGYAVYRRIDEYFAGGEVHHVQIPGEMVMDWEGLRGLTLSYSHAPMPGAVEFDAFERALKEFFARFQQNGTITLATRTWISAGRFAETSGEPDAG
ncbi:MAG TPA: class I SAM-dependent methyltransferase [Terracidiphilus sp.]|nr:class I SAM-dependent methyltransferase [Terracidiphilus sp.]